MDIETTHKGLNKLEYTSVFQCFFEVYFFVIFLKLTSHQQFGTVEVPFTLFSSLQVLE